MSQKEFAALGVPVHKRGYVRCCGRGVHVHVHIEWHVGAVSERAPVRAAKVPDGFTFWNFLNPTRPARPFED